MNNLQKENRRTILIIENDILLQKTYHLALTNAGYNVIFASTGTKGLQKLKDETPQLIILDLVIPGEMDGLDVLEQIKTNQQFVKIPLFILTNLDNKKNTALKMGVKKYFIKTNVSINTVINEINITLS
ncbi:response regulator [Patescibacteria group bacterium]|nr:response regulator [Patescibacteria group bacterium]